MRAGCTYFREEMLSIEFDPYPKTLRTVRPVVRGLLILALVTSLFLSSVVNVSADRGSPGRSSRLLNTQSSLPQQEGFETHYSYLPIIQRALLGHFVSPSGNDANDGSWARPWRTIGKAASMVSAGDIVYIREGVYKEFVKIRPSGTEQEPIKFLAYPGENPVIDGANKDPGSNVALIDIYGDYIYLSGLEVRNSARMGVYVYGNYDTVDNLYVHHCKENGILINHGKYSIVENSRIWRNVLSNEYGVQGYWSTGLSAARSGVQYATIRHNIVWENWGEGLSSYEADQVIMEDNVVHDNYSTNVYISDSTNILFQRNFVYTDPTSYVFPYSEHGGIMLGDEKYTPPSANITIINNIAFGNQGNFWWWQGVQGGGMKNVLIGNNTFVNGIGDPNLGRGGVIISQGTHQNVRFENNLVQQDGALPVIATIDQPGVTYSHNLWSKQPWEAASGPGDIIGDPLLTHTADPFTPAWYRLTGQSPAINGAFSLPNVIYDYFQNLRETSPDIGAHEFIP